MPYISESFINDLPNQINIVDLIAKRLPLKKTGSDYRAPCPFHGGKNPNLAVNSHKQFYHCFKCGESGGAIKFVQKYDNVDFPQAVETIASEFGLKVEYDSNSKPVDPSLERYRALSEKVSDFYVQQFKTSLAKEKAVNYAKNRGISGEIAKRFALGFAPPSNKDLLLNFENNEQNISDLKALGLVKTGEYGDYDFFRDRLMFPIQNSKGNVIAFGGRAFDDQVKAKYLNSQESPIFFKSKELYGLYHARKYSRSMDYILVVEGYMDVVALHQAGITKVVATLGTATTPEHLKSLERTSKTIVFCFDGDDAGRAAAWKALKIALPVIKSGLLVKFLFLPDGEDPDTLVKKESLKAFEKRIDEADTLSKFLFDHSQTEVNFETIEGKTLFLEKVSALIALVTYEVYQRQLLEGVAKIVGQSIEQVEMVFNQQAEKVQEQQIQTHQPPQIQVPNMEYEETMPTFAGDDYQDYYQSSSTPQENNLIKVMMGRMISLLLNYPLLADESGIAEERIRNIEQSEVLLKLVREAEVENEISKEELINLFKSKPGVQQRLRELSILDPYLSENQAKDEFLSALTKIEKYQSITEVKGKITSANTEEEQRKVMEGIQRNKS
ncbi:DNA primase [uncultured Candidatus Thioglobus sp.]|nr:DNA primase [uncultured Candidatus Thioglobus sp.]